MNDLELEKAALEACGYRVHLCERAGTQWLTACKGLQVRYTHWHPLTNINQAMQLLIDAPKHMLLSIDLYGALIEAEDVGVVYGLPCTPAELIAAQCRAIVTACASLKAVR